MCSRIRVSAVGSKHQIILVYEKLRATELTVINVDRAFVNNVWYIKILSPEDVMKLGKQEAESLSMSTGTEDRMNNAENTQNCLWTPVSRIA